MNKYSIVALCLVCFNLSAGEGLRDIAQRLRALGALSRENIDKQVNFHSTVEHEALEHEKAYDELIKNTKRTVSEVENEMRAVKGSEAPDVYLDLYDALTNLKSTVKDQERERDIYQNIIRRSRWSINLLSKKREMLEKTYRSIEGIIQRVQEKSRGLAEALDKGQTQAHAKLSRWARRGQRKLNNLKTDAYWRWRAWSDEPILKEDERQLAIIP